MSANPKRKQEIITLIVVFTGVVVVSALVAYYLGGGSRPTTTTTPSRPDLATRPDAAQPTASRPEVDPAAAILGEPSTQRPSETRAATADDSFIDRMFGSHTEAHTLGTTWAETMGRISLRFLLAALLGAALAFRPRKRILALKRNPYVSQTQILLAIVAAALMIVVGDNAARAFGIFAAVSLVRFRTNIRDPKEITVLLISLAIGLGTGVGRWDLAVVLTIFALILLWVLEYREPEQVFRAMNLKITTRNVERTQGLLKEIFQSHGFDSELRIVAAPKGDDKPGNVVYSVDVSPKVSTDDLSEEILA